MAGIVDVIVIDDSSESDARRRVTDEVISIHSTSSSSSSSSSESSAGLQDKTIIIDCTNSSVAVKSDDDDENQNQNQNESYNKNNRPVRLSHIQSSVPQPAVSDESPNITAAGNAAVKRKSDDKSGDSKDVSSKSSSDDGDYPSEPSSPPALTIRKIQSRKRPRIDDNSSSNNSSSEEDDDDDESKPQNQKVKTSSPQRPSGTSVSATRRLKTASISTSSSTPQRKLAMLSSSSIKKKQAGKAKRPPQSSTEDDDSLSEASNNNNKSDNEDSDYSRIFGSTSDSSEESSDDGSYIPKRKGGGYNHAKSKKRNRPFEESDEESSGDDDSSDCRKPSAKKMKKSKTGKKYTATQPTPVLNTHRIGTARCPICFSRVPEESIDNHIEICGQDLIGEFQSSTWQGENKNQSSVASPSSQSNHQQLNDDDSATDDDDKKPAAKVSKLLVNIRASNRNEKSKSPQTKLSPSRPMRISNGKNERSKSPQKKLSPSRPMRISNGKNERSKSPQKKLSPSRLVGISNGKNKKSKILQNKLSPSSPRGISNGKNGAAQNLEQETLSPRQSSAITKSLKLKFGNVTDTKITLDDQEWKTVVEDALRQVRQEETDSKNTMLQEALRAKTEFLRKRGPRAQSQFLYPLLSHIISEPLDSAHLKESDHPLPRDEFTTVFLKRHFTSPDDKADTTGNDTEDDDSDGEASPLQQNDPIKVDSSSDDDNDSTQTEVDSKIAEFRVEKIGVAFEEIETDEEIDKVLERLRGLNHDRTEVHKYLAVLLREDVERVQKRRERTKQREEPKRLHDTPYEDIMSSFRDLFCRRCLSYDCNLHGMDEEYCPNVQAEIAVQKEASGYWMNGFPPMCLPVSSPASEPDLNGRSAQRETKTIETDSKPETVLSELQKVMCQKLYHVFQDDLTKTASAMGVSQRSISKQVDLVPFQSKPVGSPMSNDNRSKSNKNNKSNTYNPNWIKRIVETKSHPFFFPCHHTESCSDETCSCVQNGFFCTKACIWGPNSRNFFRGCNCTKGCMAKNCPCFASNRECDPDLCSRCDTCTDSPNQPATTQPCRNDSIGMRRHVHLLMGKSRVAGWGLFTKEALKKGDYIHEYLGEVIPHDEAERRGAVYDQRNQTYLFDLSTDFAVDAVRKGNKTRFINHSENPNIVPSLKVVNGDFRIGFFAKRDIPAQTELFFDYGRMFFTSKGGFASPKPDESKPSKG